MGVDISLLPFDADSGVYFSHTILSLERRRDLWDPIAEIEKRFGRDVPERFTSYMGTGADGDPAYGNTQQTSYGEVLKYVLVQDLLLISKHEDITDNHKNRAIWAYLSCLPANTKVALYWH